MEKHEKSKLLMMLREDQLHRMEEAFLREFDPTNGMHSNGDILRHVGIHD